jgi:hypothetical protein
MKYRTLIYFLISMAAIGSAVIWFIRLPKDPEIIRVFNARINHACAPWDGAAFTVFISYDPFSKIEISLWRAPDIEYPTTFSFSDLTGKVGDAIYQPQVGELQRLSGKVIFQRVEGSSPVSGEFDLRSVSGYRYRGGFNAIWENHVVLCG